LLGAGGHFSNLKSPARLELIAAACQFARPSLPIDPSKSWVEQQALRGRYVRALRGLCVSARESAALDMLSAQLEQQAVRPLQIPAINASPTLARLCASAEKKHYSTKPSKEPVVVSYLQYLNRVAAASGPSPGKR
jgi:hypothetical protein